MSIFKQATNKNSSVEYKTLATKYYDNGTVSSGTCTIDYSKGDHHKVTAGGNFTLAFSNLPASGKSWGILIECVNWGAHTITLTSIGLTEGGTALSFTSSGTDDLVVFGKEGSSNISGKIMLTDKS